MISEVASRFGGCVSTYDSAASVQRKVAERLALMLAPHAQSGGAVFEVGCGTGLLSELIVRSVKPSALLLNDVSPDMLIAAQRRAQTAGCPNVSLLNADAESSQWPQADIVVSASAVQWFSNPLSAVRNAAEALPVGGLLAIATYGPLTFRELRGGEPSDYPDLALWKAELSSCGFEVLESDESTLMQEFPSRVSLLRMVAATGVGTRQKNQSAGSIRGVCRLTWQPLLFVARLHKKDYQNLNE